MKVLITYNSHNYKEKRAAMESTNKLHKAKIGFHFNRTISTRCFVIVNEKDYKQAQEIIALK